MAHPDVIAEVVDRLEGRPILLIGMMGAGKTTVGRRLAAKLGLDFFDSDAEIETAANMTIPEIFENHGEDEFRAGESRVIARLLKQKNAVIATGGGAFMNAETRELVRQEAVSVWIKAEFELLFARVSKRANRPLLKTPDPRATLKALIEKRYPTYALADLTIVSRDVPHDVVANEVIAKLKSYLRAEAHDEHV